MKIAAFEFETMGDAIQHANAAGGESILLRGRPMVVSQADVDRLAQAGVEFAMIVDHELPDETRTILTIPVN